MVQISQFNITELDTGETTIVTTCFTARLSQPTTREVRFPLILSNMTTADGRMDFFMLSPPDVVIPFNSSGNFQSCLDIVQIFGDDFVENDEVIVYEVLSSSSDRVLFPVNSPPFLRIVIAEDDSMLLAIGVPACT